MNEKQLQEAIRQVAELRGWLYFHTFDSRRSPAGYPDVVLCKPPRLIFAELKSDVGRLRAEQKLWLDKLRACGQEVHIWRPADLDSIVEILGARTAASQEVG